MYAIVEIAGQQFKVEKNKKLFVHRLNEKEGSKVLLDNVLLLDDGKKINIDIVVLNRDPKRAKTHKRLQEAIQKTNRHGKNPALNVNL